MIPSSQTSPSVPTNNKNIQSYPANSQWQKSEEKVRAFDKKLQDLQQKIEKKQYIVATQPYQNKVDECIDQEYHTIINDYSGKLTQSIKQNDDLKQKIRMLCKQLEQRKNIASKCRNLQVQLEQLREKRKIEKVVIDNFQKGMKDKEIQNEQNLKKIEKRGQEIQQLKISLSQLRKQTEMDKNIYAQQLKQEKKRYDSIISKLKLFSHSSQQINIDDILKYFKSIKGYADYWKKQLFQIKSNKLKKIMNRNRTLQESPRQIQDKVAFQLIIQQFETYEKFLENFSNLTLTIQEKRFEGLQKNFKWNQIKKSQNGLIKKTVETVESLDSKRKQAIKSRDDLLHAIEYISNNLCRPRQQIVYNYSELQLIQDKVQLIRSMITSINKLKKEKQDLEQQRKKIHEELKSQQTRINQLSREQEKLQKQKNKIFKDCQEMKKKLERTEENLNRQILKKEEKIKQIDAQKRSIEKQLKLQTQDRRQFEKNVKQFEKNISMDLGHALKQDIKLNHYEYRECLDRSVVQINKLQARKPVLAESEIFINLPDIKRTFLMNLFNQAVGGRTPARSKTLIQIDESIENMSEVFRRINGKPNIFVLIKLQNDYVLGGFTQEPFSQNARKHTSGFIFSVNQQKKYTLKRKNDVFIIKPDHYYFIFGNSELVIKPKGILTSLIGSHNNFFDMGSHGTSELFGYTTKQTNYSRIQFHELIYV